VDLQRKKAQPHGQDHERCPAKEHGAQLGRDAAFGQLEGDGKGQRRAAEPEHKRPRLGDQKLGLS
jgi:hypothetical protein